MEQAPHALEIFTHVRKTLTRRGSWIQHEPALDKHGSGVFGPDERASRWCLTGAIDRAISSLSLPDECELYDKVCDNLFDWMEDERFFVDESYISTLDMWNDSRRRRHSHVKAMLDEYLEYLQWEQECAQWG